MRKIEMINWVLQIEKGFSNNPNDKGKKTKYGISEKSYPDLDIENLSLERAKEIYERDYWIPCSIESLPQPVDLAVFDMAINSGVQASAKLLQRIVGVTPDGIIGGYTISAVKLWNPLDLFNELLWERIKFYKGLSDFNHFGKGWINRILALREYGLNRT